MVFTFQCPHCAEYIEVDESQINCAIFRHAVLKENMQQINPHAPELECADLVSSNKVYGCAGPFRIIKKENGTYVAEKCDYI